MKYKRHSAIVRIVKEKKIRTHEQLIEELRSEGYNVTQATVSRDIKEIGLVKVPSEMGSVYAVASRKHASAEKKIKSIADAVLEIDCAMHTVVVKTYPGMASAVGASVDDSLKEEFIGSIAGDDVLLIITKGIEEAKTLTQDMRRIFRCEEEE